MLPAAPACAVARRRIAASCTRLRRLWVSEAASLKSEYTTFSNHRTSCVWKGQAYYMSLFVNGEMNPDSVWYYPEPTDSAAEIKDRVAFKAGVSIVD